eukprot:1557589-Karenia_brevis.AAC.1
MSELANRCNRCRQGREGEEGRKRGRSEGQFDQNELEANACESYIHAYRPMQWLCTPDGN